MVDCLIDGGRVRLVDDRKHPVEDSHRRRHPLDAVRIEGKDDPRLHRQCHEVEEIKPDMKDFVADVLPVVN